MSYFVACADHASIDVEGLKHAQARAEHLNSRARADLRLCQHPHFGVEALTADAAKAQAAVASRRLASTGA